MCGRRLASNNFQVQVVISIIKKGSCGLNDGQPLHPPGSYRNRWWLFCSPSVCLLCSTCSLCAHWADNLRGFILSGKQGMLRCTNMDGHVGMLMYTLYQSGLRIES